MEGGQSSFEAHANSLTLKLYLRLWSVHGEGVHNLLMGAWGLEGCERGFEKGKEKKLNTKPTDQCQGGTGLILTKRVPPSP